MKSDKKEKWLHGIDKEQKRIVKASAFKVIKHSILNLNEKLITSTQAMKKKSNGKYCARLHTCSYKQECGIHYKYNEISFPIVNDITVQVIFIIILITRFDSHIVDINSTFLLVHFNDKDTIYIEIPDRFEKYFVPNDIVKL